MWYFGPQNMGRPALSNRKKCQLGLRYANSDRTILGGRVMLAESPGPAEGCLLNEFRDPGRARRARDGGALAGLKLSVPGVHAERAVAPYRLAP